MCPEWTRFRISQKIYRQCIIWFSNPISADSLASQINHFFAAKCGTKFEAENYYLKNVSFMHQQQLMDQNLIKCILQWFTKKNWWSTIWCVGLFTGLCKSYYLTTINCCISWTNIFLYYHHQRISTSCNQTTDFMDEHHVGCCCKFVYRFRHVSNVWQYSEWRRF